MNPQYLAEFRQRGLRVLIGILAGTVTGVLFSNKIILLSLGLFNFTGVNVVMTSPSQLIDLQLYTGLVTGLLVGTPIFLVESFGFIRPAFSSRELTLISKFIPIGIGLFVAGSTFGAWVTQFIVMIYSKYSAEFRVNNIWDIQHFFSQVVVTAILMGFVFQLPLLMTMLIRLELVPKKIFRENRRYVYALLMLIAVLLPPTDILSLILLTTPLLFLFEIGLLLNVGKT